MSLKISDKSSVVSKIEQFARAGEYVVARREPTVFMYLHKCKLEMEELNAKKGPVVQYFDVSKQSEKIKSQLYKLEGFFACSCSLKNRVSAAIVKNYL